mmetsp:Transcript_44366/g.96535  ORF Transcript_44366/g.96535 Transcript_44366/m.96535 type:complete len:89 (+) Transcript_44366:3-269(+)
MPDAEASQDERHVVRMPGIKKRAVSAPGEVADRASVRKLLQIDSRVNVHALSMQRYEKKHEVHHLGPEDDPRLRFRGLQTYRGLRVIF